MSLPRIHVHSGGRYLITETGDPFFWLGDTAWELFHRLSEAEAEQYLETRRQQGYNVIQAVALAELNGLNAPNAKNHTPLLGHDPTRPNEYYFRHVDRVIRLAAAKGLYIGLLPTWADKVVASDWGDGPLIFNAENARIYGKFLGQRYRNDSNILWILGGDRPAEGCEALWAAMADGIVEGLGYRPFFTYHPNGGSSSSRWLHQTAWLDMNMFQSGHVLVDTPNWEMIARDYGLTPARPVLDGEPNYEDHPIDPYLRPWKPEYGRYSDYDVRKQAYRAVFSGGCGHTYGHHSVWQFWSLARTPINFPMPTWDEAILRPGAKQMVFVKNLMLSRPYFSRIPAQDMLPNVKPTPPADVKIHHDPLRAAYPCATRCADGSYAFVYFPMAQQRLQVDLRLLSGRVKAQWYDPRTGLSYDAGEYANEVTTFESLIAGPDWVLVLDSAAQNFSAPGHI
jgi:hypothetical protein